MKRVSWAFVSVLLLAGGHSALVQAAGAPKIVLGAQDGMVTSQQRDTQLADVFDALREKHALRIF
jgi:hypothetical protein